jgi:hypothetical protein
LKSYFLEGLDNEDEARRVLSALLPGQADPWLLLSPDGDPIAYLNIASVCSPKRVSIEADVSGRHYNSKVILSVLTKLRDQLGGEIRDDDDNVA